MTADELRGKYLDFFRGKDHAIIKSAPLVPENDPTVLFTTAGMHPLVPFILGQKHPLGKRLANFQKCIRTGDIEEVGDDVHLTFFEMLGNWSLGDYFKQEAIEWSYEFLTAPEWLNLAPERLAVSVFAGDADAPFDQESKDQWLSLGIPESRIAGLPKEENWWGPAGQTGPCGPDTEMFYWVGAEPVLPEFDPEDGRWMEIWNDVFMQYNKTAAGTFEPLAQKVVDTGMGLERVAAVLQGQTSCYDTELFAPLFARLTEISGHQTPRSERSGRIVVEHLRSAAFIMADGITPGNLGQAYVLRRLIRRAIRECRKLGVTKPFTANIAEVVIAGYKHVYPELEREAKTILAELEREEAQFNRTLERGERELTKMIGNFPPHVHKKVISGRQAFYVYETYGFPLELTREIAAEHGFAMDEVGFRKAEKKHQERSRQAGGAFKGGLQDQSENTTRLHTATHLLHKALKSVLGDHVQQKGSNITAERLRFDFSHPEKLTPDQLAEVERIVNEQIQRGLAVTVEELPLDEAKARGALAYFAERYGEKVKLYTIGDFSLEICGGPHVENTKELGGFKIKKEESSSRGVRRIKAVVTNAS